MTAGVVAGWTGAVGLLLFIVGIIAVLWDWSVKNNPDAPTGGPIVAVSFVFIVIAMASGCSQIVTDVHDMKRQQPLQQR